MGQDSFKLTDYRRGTASTVPCPRCGALVPAAGTMCAQCGLHFRGPAAEFAPEAHRAYKPRRTLKLIATLIILGLLAAIVIGVILTFHSASK
ncbi:MAG: hypothetical protein WD768_04740 [Phycisphaeraceae bacterium]